MKKFSMILVFSTMLNADISLSSMVSDIKTGAEDAVVAVRRIALDVSNSIDTNETETDKFGKIWERAYDKLEEGGALEAKLDNVPESSWISSDKSSVKNDINEILDDVISILMDDKYLSYREDTKDLKNNIKDFKSTIIDYRTKKISAPLKHLVQTTKDGYDEKIKDTMDEIEATKKEISLIQDELKNYLIKSGVELNSEQIDMLLDSVDGDDMIKMTLVLKVLNQVTEQLMSLLEDSNEDLKFAKKYYAMHLLSFDLVVHIYQKYLDKVEKYYLVKLKQIMNETSSMLITTKNLYANEKNEDRKTMYRKNIQAQELTQKAGRLYIDYLHKNRSRVQEVQKIAIKNLILARNTYRTVSLSNQLQKIMADDKQIFSKLLKIKMPDIVPFENTQLKIKYQELTVRLQEGYE